MRYAEACSSQPAPEARMEKGNRDEIEGKVFIGNYDEFVPEGGARRTFRPLWWRTYRYLELDIETRDAAAHHRRPEATYVGFPVRAPGEVRYRRAGAEPHPRRRLAHRAAVRPRDLHGLPYYEQLPVRRRHARAVPGLALHRPAMRG